MGIAGSSGFCSGEHPGQGSGPPIGASLLDVPGEWVWREEVQPGWALASDTGSAPVPLCHRLCPWAGQPALSPRLLICEMGQQQRLLRWVTEDEGTTPVRGGEVSCGQALPPGSAGGPGCRPPGDRGFLLHRGRPKGMSSLPRSGPQSPPGSWPGASCAAERNVGDGGDQRATTALSHGPVPRGGPGGRRRLVSPVARDFVEGPGSP